MRGHVQPTPRSPRKVWLLVVWQAASSPGLIARLKLLQTAKNPSNYYRYYPQRGRVEAAIALLTAAGLHGNAKLVDEPRKKPRFKKQFRVVSREGFGGKLNAAPIAGSWRRKARRK